MFFSDFYSTMKMDELKKWIWQNCEFRSRKKQVNVSMVWD